MSYFCLSSRRRHTRGALVTGVQTCALPIYVGLSNLDPNQTNTVTVKLDGLNAANVSGRILTAPAINSHNSFDAPEVVKPAAFTGAQVSGELGRASCRERVCPYV